MGHILFIAGHLFHLLCVNEPGGVDCQLDLASLVTCGSIPLQLSSLKLLLNLNALELVSILAILGTLQVQDLAVKLVVLRG